MNPVWHFLDGVPQIGPLSVTSAGIAVAGRILVGSNPAPATVGIGLTNNEGIFFRQAGGAGLYPLINGDGSNNILIGGTGPGVILALHTIRPNSTASDLGSTSDPFRTAYTGGLLANSASTGVGYTTGAGGTVAQGSGSGKATGVTLNKTTGQITMDGAALNAGVEVTFVLTNSAIAATDVVIVNHSSAGTAGAYLVGVSAVGAGSCSITVSNASAGNLSEAIVLSFAVIKGASA